MSPRAALPFALLFALLLAACAAPPPPPVAPAPALPAPPPAPTATPTPPVPAPAPPAPAATAPPAPAQIGIHLSLEPPFRLDQRVFPAARAAFLADLKDRTAWNTGGMGELTAEPPPVPGHPAPKVIIDVLRASGSLKAAEAQRVLRKGFWMTTVNCYALTAYKDQKLRGKAFIKLTVSARGKVTGARTTQSDFPDHDIPRCLEEHLRAFSLPGKKGRSTLSLEFQIGHGDEPVPPPHALVVPGEGTLSPEAIQAVIEAARPTFEACYRPALDYAPGLWGRLGIRFHVTEKGKVDEAFEAESQFPDERVKLCVLRAARTLTFPAPTGGDMRFIAPLRLSSDRSAPPPPPDPR